MFVRLVHKQFSSLINGTLSGLVILTSVIHGVYTYLSLNISVSLFGSDIYLLLNKNLKMPTG